MKQLKVAILGIFLLGGMMVNAQQKGTISPEERATRMTEQVSTDLSLTEEKKAQIGKINLDFSMKMDRLHKDESISKEEKQAKRKELVNYRDQEYKIILSEEEYAKFQELENQRKAQEQLRRQERRKDYRSVNDK